MRFMRGIEYYRDILNSDAVLKGIYANACYKKGGKP